VLVEKPMANTTAECDRMLAAAARSGRKLAVGHLQRFFPANRAVRELVTSEKLGRFCMFSERRTIDYFSADRPLWFLDRRTAGGGIVMNYGAHVLDKLFGAVHRLRAVYRLRDGNELKPNDRQLTYGRDEYDRRSRVVRYVKPVPVRPSGPVGTGYGYRYRVTVTGYGYG